tara:strand:- start:971 stop:1207 length:237 start_codon:yes stop_codon:yes gene_type:complete
MAFLSSKSKSAESTPLVVEAKSVILTPKPAPQKKPMKLPIIHLSPNVHQISPRKKSVPAANEKVLQLPIISAKKNVTR